MSAHAACPLKDSTAFLIGVAGGSCSGKSAVIRKVVDGLTYRFDNRPAVAAPCISIVNIESFFKPLDEEQQTMALAGQMNMDHPGVIDENAMLRTMQIIAGTEKTPGQSDSRVVGLNRFNYGAMKHEEETMDVRTPCDIVFLEGGLVFYSPKLRQMMNLMLFVDCDPDIRLARRVLRDMNKYQRSLPDILEYHSKYGKTAFEEYCLPTKKYAHVIIPRGSDNEVAIDVIVQHLHELLVRRRQQSSLVQISTVQKWQSNQNESNNTSLTGPETTDLVAGGKSVH